MIWVIRTVIVLGMIVVWWEINKKLLLLIYFRHRWTGRYEAHLWDNSCRREGQTRKGRQGTNNARLHIQICCRTCLIFPPMLLTDITTSLWLFLYWLSWFAGLNSTLQSTVYLGTWFHLIPVGLFFHSKSNRRKHCFSLLYTNNPFFSSCIIDRGLWQRGESC